jgi:hypothetical protein
MNMKPFGRCTWAGLLLLWLACYSVEADSAPRVRCERVPENGVQPQVLVDQAGTIHLVYLRGDPKACDVMNCRRPAGQADFTSPMRVNSKPGSAIAIGTVRGAQLALGRNGRVHIVWNGSEQASSKPSGSAPMLYSRLSDAGDTFEPQRDLMTSTTHLDGGGSVAADSQGRVYVVWHGHKKTGPQEEIDRGVFVAFSDDEGKTFTPERQVNPTETGVCGCCGLKAFADNKGELGILYRSANLIGNRDSILLLSTNYGASFTATVLGDWHVSTCPMSTHALGQGPAGLLGIWEKQGQIYFGSPLPGRASSLDPTAAAGNTGNRKHPAFALDRTKGSPLVIAWTEGTGWEKGGSLVWECLDAKGAQLASGRADGVPVWSFAAAFAEPDGSFTVLY